MRLTLEATEQFFMAGEVMVRAWRGENEQGEPVLAMIAAVMVGGNPDHTAPGLVSIPPPTEDDARRWAAEVLSRRYSSP
jgi:hypothetical protein